MLGIENERYINSPPLQLLRFFAVKEKQEMACQAILAAPGIDSPSLVLEAMPVKKHGGEKSEEPVRDLVRPMRV